VVCKVEDLPLCGAARHTHHRRIDVALGRFEAACPRQFIFTYFNFAEQQFMSSSNTTRLIPVFSRLFWMIVGPLVLVLATYFIVNSGSGWTTTADLLFFVTLGGMILGRWFEFRGGNPETSTGDLATVADLRRYILTVIVVGPTVWAIANILGNHVLRR
jgi:hypothetical protein